MNHPVGLEHVPVFHEELLDYLPGDEVLDVDGELVGQLVGHQGHPTQRNDSSQVLFSLLWVQIPLKCHQWGNYRVVHLFALHCLLTSS